jgi:glycosyltransferase involved in cell wall biosynthesis
LTVSTLNIGFVSASDVAGGAEAHAVALAQGLRDRGHDVVLHGRCPGWEQQGLLREDLDLGPKWSRKTLLTGVLRAPLERHRVRSVARRSVYYLQFKREQIALTEPLSRKAPVVWVEHGRWLDGAMGRVLLGAYGRAARHVARVVCISEAVADDLRRAVDPSKLVVIPNAIDTARFRMPTEEARSALRARLLPTLTGRTVGILAARLHPAKRHGRAISAALASGSALVVLGDGPARADLERQAAPSGEVVFVGRRENVADYLAAADYYLYCGAPTDGMPTSVLEAASCGLPIVGFAGDPGLELVDRCGGLALADPADLTPDLLTQLLKRSGQAVAYVRRQHSRDALIDSYERLFREVAG